MKRTSKLLTALALACLLAVLSCAPAFAENGPFQKDLDGWYPAFLSLGKLDENEEPVTEDQGGWQENVSLPLFVNNKATPQEGAEYDLATNTLTLTDFNKGNYSLQANMMGDDFTIKVIGECRLSYIDVWGDNWGGSLHITGDGSLTVNPNKKTETGIRFIPEGADVTFTVDPSVTVDIYGSKTAVLVYGGEGEVSIDTGAGEEKLEVKNAEREQFIWIRGYSNPGTDQVIPGRCADDPVGFYDVHETVLTDADGTKEDLVLVTRYYYVSEKDLYLQDHDWANGEDEKWSGSKDFPDLAAAEAAGFTQILDENGEANWTEINTLGNFGSETVWADKDGNRYVKDWDFDEDWNSFDVALTIEKAEGTDDLYIFTVAPDVDPAELTELTEIHVYDDMFDCSYPGEHFSHKGESGDFKAGDVNADGQVLANDARLALRASASLEKLNDTQTKAADVDEDGKVLANDARQILRFSAQLQTEFKKAAA